MKNDRLVSHCILVLRLLSRGEKHVNAVIEETGLYKEFVHEAITMLQQGRFIKESKTRSHKQKKIQQLTELGIESVKLMSDIEQIKRSHSELKGLVVEKFGIENDLDETRIKNRLRSRGWSSKEIDFYREFTVYAVLLITESLNMAYNVLTYRYSSLLLKYGIKGFAKTILNSIILDALEYHLLIVGDNAMIRKLYCMKDNNERARVTMDRLLSSIEAIEEHNPYLNRFTDKDGERLLTSICSMLELPKNVIGDHISSVNTTLKLFGAEWMQGGADTHFYHGSMFKNAYEETRRKSQRKLSILNKMLEKSS
jgi:DNA-binding PadR family transcriptional regulator